VCSPTLILLQPKVLQAQALKPMDFALGAVMALPRARLEALGGKEKAGAVLARKGEPLLLSKLQMKQELMADYRELLPAMPPDQWRRIRGEQEIIVRYEPEQALATLPKLLAHQGDRDKLVTLVRRLLADDRVRRAKPSTAQLAMVEHIGETLAVGASATRRSPVRRKSKSKSIGKRARSRGE
jgi:hypothetical protein